MFSSVTIKVHVSAPYLKDRYQHVIVEDNLTQANSTSDWGKIKHGVPQGSILCVHYFLFYINDLPKGVNMISQPILFADDTSIIVNNPNSINFKKDAHLIMAHITTQ
jgi:hypothetical protein